MPENLFFPPITGHAKSKFIKQGGGYWREYMSSTYDIKDGKIKSFMPKRKIRNKLIDDAEIMFGRKFEDLENEVIDKIEKYVNDFYDLTKQNPKFKKLNNKRKRDLKRQRKENEKEEDKACGKSEFLQFEDDESELNSKTQNFKSVVDICRTTEMDTQYKSTTLEQLVNIQPVELFKKFVKAHPDSTTNTFYLRHFSFFMEWKIRKAKNQDISTAFDSFIKRRIQEGALGSALSNYIRAMNFFNKEIDKNNKPKIQR